MNKTRQLTLSALCVGLLCLCAFLVVPGPVPFTLQTFGAFLTLLVLGGKNGTLAIGVYLLMGGLGLPVFAGGQGGFGVLFGPTGGYLLGFLLIGLGYGSIPCKNEKNRAAVLAAGLLACYLFGTLWYAALFAGGKALGGIILTCVAPFVIPDGVKLYLALLIYRRLKKAKVL